MPQKSTVKANKGSTRKTGTGFEARDTSENMSTTKGAKTTTPTTNASKTTPTLAPGIIIINGSTPSHASLLASLLNAKSTRMKTMTAAVTRHGLASRYHEGGGPISMSMTYRIQPKQRTTARDAMESKKLTKQGMFLPPMSFPTKSQK
eukprot:CAMPEP_0119330594 /NCGR_PEP_ID=MMETSP1333-20130426/78557_1 /TAXON_ID=418940 /ORGANISM="Scyphosphaera apsteinii, Strain RCC1455" /LENGTH=147 /DNA_ID=CAMNT_0007339999 /DNA_START=414 /DNA_END=857 /DNA_ORIENTATION=+